MTKKLLWCLFLVMSVMLIGVSVSAEASSGTAISTVVPQKYSITFDIDGGGSIEYEDVLYKNGDSVQVTEGSDLNLVLHADSQYRVKKVSYNGENVTKQVSDGNIMIKNIQQNGKLVVTYTKITKIGSVVIPPITGDDSHILIWSILALGNVGIAIITFNNKKSKHS